MLLYYLSLVEDNEEKSKVEQLYWQYRKLMKYISSKILNNEDLVEDAVHDAFVLIIENLSRIDDVYANRTKAFIAVITRNVALNLRAKTNKYVSLDSQVIEESVVYQKDPLERVYINEWLVLIAELPPIYRDPLQLKVQYELKNKEIAKILGVSPQVVAKRLERGRKMLMEKRNEENV